MKIDRENNENFAATVRRIFALVIDLPQEERALYLDQVCEDDIKHRQEIESLIAADDSAITSSYSIDEAMSALFGTYSGEDLPDFEGELPPQPSSHYKILDEIGRGGMGVVYKALDTRLGRTVVLKFLAPHLNTNSEAKARFIREAQSASALDHAHICTIYEIGEAPNGNLYIAMAYYEGQTLKEMLTGGRLSIEDVVNYAKQIAIGLSCAHEANIVHRDIKPANIIITDRGEVKLLDFGLAKLAGQGDLTKDGSTLGTVAYMSPEQAQGDEVDYRTDLWSLGIVLYEMLIGRRPFRGEYEQAVIYGILHQSPTPLTLLRNEVPVALERIVLKLLSKKPEERYQTSHALVEALTHLYDRTDESERSLHSADRTSWLYHRSTYGIIGGVLALSVVLVFLLNMNRDNENKTTDDRNEAAEYAAGRVVIKERDVDDVIAPLRWVARPAEISEIARGTTKQERKERFEAFWEKRDPTPSTPTNERLEEYYSRVDNANLHYGEADNGLDGWETDRGRTIIIYGEPDRIERSASREEDNSEQITEVWHYDRIGRRFTFVDRSDTKSFELKLQSGPE